MEYTKKIYNVETGEETTVPLSPEELALIKANETALEAELAAEAAAEEARKAAEAKLEALGITANDLRALGL